MRLGKCHQHSGIVGGPQDLGEAQVRARLAAVVVRVNEVDAELLHPQHRLLRTLVRRGGGAHLCIVEGNRREIDPASIEIEIAAVDPEFAEAEPLGIRCVDDPVARHQGQAEPVLVLGSDDVPELLRVPLRGE